MAGFRFAFTEVWADMAGWSATLACPGDGGLTAPTQACTPPAAAAYMAGGAEAGNSPHSSTAAARRAEDTILIKSTL